MTQDDFPKVEEAEFNACVLAAAPELLSIAVRLQEWDKKWPKYSDRTGQSEKEMDAICLDAAKLVKKATDPS